MLSWSWISTDIWFIVINWHLLLDSMTPSPGLFCDPRFSRNSQPGVCNGKSIVFMCCEGCWHTGFKFLCHYQHSDLQQGNRPKIQYVILGRHLIDVEKVCELIFTLQNISKISVQIQIYVNIVWKENLTLAQLPPNNNGRRCSPVFGVDP